MATLELLAVGLVLLSPVLEKEEVKGWLIQQAKSAIRVNLHVVHTAIAFFILLCLCALFLWLAYLIAATAPMPSPISC